MKFLPMKKKRDTRNKKLKTAELDKFRAELLAKVTEILSSVSSMEVEALRRERSDLSNMPIHMADIGSDNFEIENTLGLMDSEKKLLIEIYDALKRIEEGTYGVCEKNGEPISKARLKAVPWARYCLDCASLLEKKGYAPELKKAKGNVLALEEDQEESQENAE